MTRTLAKPVDDPNMWRRIAAKAHPDAGGDGELFVWLTAVRDHVCEAKTNPREHVSGETPPRQARDTRDDSRIEFQAGEDFDDITLAALRCGRGNPGLYADILSLLRDCESRLDKRHEEQRGASYKRLAAVAHAVGMTKQERIGWYRVCESIPLSDRHAGHILSRLKRSRRAA